MSQYNVSNPHPNYGKDPNVINEYGHTKYPKMVYPSGHSTSAVGPQKGEGIIVNNEKEEAEAMGTAKEEVKETKKEDKKEDKKAEGWGKDK